MENHALASEKKTADGTPRVIGYADEAAFYLVPSVGVTWARKGQTPVLCDGDRYGHLSVISLITETGDLCYQIQDGSYHGDDVVRCLRQVRETYPTTVTMMWDGVATRSTPSCGRRITGRFSWNSCPPTARNSMRMSRCGRMSKSLNCPISVVKRAMNSDLMSLRRSNDSNSSPI